MKANNHSQPEEQKRCFFCKLLFTPYPHVWVRQYACSRERCQAIRQRLNELDWHRRNCVKGDVWYQVYYKAWRRKHPNYQKRYRLENKRKLLTEAAQTRIRQSKEKLKRLLQEFQVFQAERRKQLQEQEHHTFAAIRIQRAGQLSCGYG
jgi:hypothetical protein